MSATETDNLNASQTLIDLAQPTAPSTLTGPAGSTGRAAASVDLFADVADESDISTKYLPIFIDETELSLDSLTEVLLGEQGEGTVKGLMVTSHRIKGSAASIGLHRAAKLAHLMEDVLQDLLQSEEEMTVSVVDSLLRCIDTMRGYNDRLKQGEFAIDGFNEIYHELQAVHAAGGEEAGDDQDETKALASGTSDSKSSSGSLDPSVPGYGSQKSSVESTLLAPGETGYMVRATFRKNLPLLGLKARLLHDKAAQLGNVVYCDPEANTLDDLDTLDCLTIGLATSAVAHDLRQHLQLDGIESINLDEIVGVALKENNLEPKKSSREPQKNCKPNETLRVDVQRLDQLMNLAGELAIGKSRITQISEGLQSVAMSKQLPKSLTRVCELLDQIEQEPGDGDNKKRSGHKRVRAHTHRIRTELEKVQRDVDQFAGARTMIDDLSEAIHQLELVSSGIQKTVMETRMVPIGPLFTRFKRVVRDITSDTGKEIGLVIRGENTELDKRVIDELADPLIHTIRNAADHGIETQQVRTAAGKPSQGTITLDAFHRGKNVVIEISDDGQGLDAAAIRSKAIEKGLLSELDAQDLSDHQLFQYIWKPGFSTAGAITEISGRGMGMDIARAKIESLNGTVELHSKPGEGTTISIQLPLTLAIVSSLLAEIDGDVFAIPVESVNEIVSVRAEDFSTVHGQVTAIIRGRVISVVELSETFSWNQPAQATTSSSSSSSDTMLVIVGTQDQQIGLVVDCLLGKEDLVIKSVAENYQNVEGIVGASILGDGAVSLIIDVVALLVMSSQRAES